MGKISIYATGIFCCSACVPGDLSREQVEDEVNRVSLCGTAKGWTVSEDATFHGGQPMPCVCESDPTRKHWLLEA
jgi:hypothetical protein